MCQDLFMTCSDELMGAIVLTFRLLEQSYNWPSCFSSKSITWFSTWLVAQPPASVSTHFLSQVVNLILLALSPSPETLATLEIPVNNPSCRIKLRNVIDRKYPVSYIGPTLGEETCGCGESLGGRGFQSPFKGPRVKSDHTRLCASGARGPSGLNLL